MSVEGIVQRANAEADEAEREDPEPEPEPDPSPDPEPEPEPEPVSKADLDKLGKRLDAENERHEKRLRELYGAMFEDMRDCPLCLAEGYMLPVPLEARDPAQVAAVHAALGELEQPELQMMEGVERCPKCDGWGTVETPSRNELNRTKPCLGCDSRGYREVIADAVNWAPPAPPVYGANNGMNYAPVQGEVDQWNRPATHPHFNLDPRYVT